MTDSYKVLYMLQELCIFLRNDLAVVTTVYYAES